MQTPKLPLYEMFINDDDETGVDFISIVKEPAIEQLGVAFHDHKHLDFTPNALPPVHPNCKCSITNGKWNTEPGVCPMCIAAKKTYDEKQFSATKQEFSAIKDKQIIVGPVMIPDKKIYRIDQDGEYMVFFSAETILKMKNKFLAANRNRNINIDHTDTTVKGFISESWIIEDKKFDKSNIYGFDLPVGTWMTMVQILDTNFWNTQVKEEGKFSFSIEGLLGMLLIKAAKQVSNDQFIDSLTDEEINEILKSINE